ncbi:MAG TPA: tyrosine--tRNA ligase [Acidimicrobiales bacterium]|nr:tyrosine--tRNA ligase [Acidimicrobiales bacterium]
MTADDLLLDDLEARGLVQDTTGRAALARRLGDGPVALYYGCDPTADSLHVGNLIGLLVLRRFQDAGHHPVALAGGATGMVGDPSGRSEERNLLDEEVLARNVAAIKAQMARLLDFEGGRAELVDNREWTAGLTLLDFLRDVGKHVTVNQMLARESVRARLSGESGISFTEFSYMLLQAHDYLRLHVDRGVDLQVGGSDQWGNMVSGVDLVRRVTGDAVHALSWPLLLAPDGTKLGKTTGARVWLDPAKTSPYQFFQHWMQADDRQVRDLLAKFTLFPVAEVDEVAAEHARHPERRVGQRRLADEVTRLVHGEAAAASAAEASLVLFGEDPREASAGALATVAAEVPGAALPAELPEGGVSVVDALVATGLARSKGDARRSVAQGAVAVNGERVGDDARVTTDEVLHGRYVVLRNGRRRYAVLVLDGGPGPRPPADLPAPPAGGGRLAGP